MTEVNPQKTPVLRLSLPDAGEKIREQLVAELTNVERSSTVAAARSKFEETVARCEKLDRAFRNLQGRSGELSKLIETESEAYIEALVEGDGRPDKKLAGRVLDFESEARLVTRAISRIAEWKMQPAKIAQMRAEAVLERARGDAMLVLSEARAQRIVSAMQATLDTECIAQIDTRSGVTGALVEAAKTCQRNSQTLEADAHELERNFLGSKGMAQ